MKQKKRSIRTLITVAAAVIMMMAMSITSLAASKVTGLKQTNASSSSVTFVWSADLSANKYNVAIATSKTGTYSSKGTTYSTQAYISGLNAGSVYYVKVQSVSSNGTTGAWSEPLQVVTAPTSIASSTLKQYAATTGAVKLKWGSVKGATGYYIYRGDTKLKAVTTNTAAVTAKAGSWESYKVYPYKKSNAGYVAKASYSSVLAKAAPGKMSQVAMASKNNLLWNVRTNRVMLGWDLGSTQDYTPSGYKVEVYSVDGKTKLKTYTVSSRYTDFTLSAVKNKGFQVRVRGYVTIDGKNYYGIWSDKKVVIPQACVSSTISYPASGSIKFTWTGVSGAQKYYVYAAKNVSSSSVDSSDFKKVATVSSSTRSYTITGLTKGKYVAVYVLPVVSVNGKSYTGTFSSYSYTNVSK